MTQPAPVPTPPPGDPAPAPTAPTPAAPPVDPSNPLKADLAKERDRRQKLEAALAQSLGVDLRGGGDNDSYFEQITAKLTPLQQLAAAFGGGQNPPPGKSEVELLNEKFSSYETELQTERQARWRAEVAAAKGLTPEQAARLQGASPEELAADADALVALFPAAGPRTPAPDPSQGARGGQPGPDLAAQITEARAKGDFRKAISLERQKLNNIQRPS